MNTAIDHYKAQGIDLSAILYKPEVGENVPLRNVSKQDHGLDNVLDVEIVSKAQKAIIKKRHKHCRLISRTRIVVLAPF